MQQVKSTKITLHSDKPTAITSSKKNANIDVMAFNILFIALRKPILAVEVMKLYQEAYKLEIDDPIAPDEDYDLAVSHMREVLDTSLPNSNKEE